MSCAQLICNVLARIGCRTGTARLCSPLHFNQIPNPLNLACILLFVGAIVYIQYSNALYVYVKGASGPAGDAVGGGARGARLPGHCAARVRRRAARARLRRRRRRRSLGRRAREDGDRAAPTAPDDPRERHRHLYDILRRLLNINTVCVGI